MLKIAAGHYYYDLEASAAAANRPPPQTLNDTHSACDCSDCHIHRRLMIRKGAAVQTDDGDSRLMPPRAPPDVRRTLQIKCDGFVHDHHISDGYGAPEIVADIPSMASSSSDSSYSFANLDQQKSVSCRMRTTSDRFTGSVADWDVINQNARDNIATKTSTKKLQKKNSSASSLMTLLQRERMECGKSSPWVPILGRDGGLEKRSKSERKETSTSSVDFGNLSPNHGAGFNLNRSISDSRLMMNASSYLSPTDESVGKYNSKNCNDNRNGGVMLKDALQTIRQTLVDVEDDELAGTGYRESDVQRYTVNYSAKQFQRAVDEDFMEEGSVSEWNRRYDWDMTDDQEEEELLCRNWDRDDDDDEDGERWRRRRGRRLAGQSSAQFSAEMPAAVRPDSRVAKVGVPVVMMSDTPYAHFFGTLYEMGKHIMAEATQGLRPPPLILAAELEELLFCYLALNSPSLAHLIRQAFAHAISHLLLLSP